MNRIITLFSVLFFFAFAFKTSAQTTKKPEGKTVKTVYYYQFEGAKSLEEVNALGKEILALKNVTEFKPVFKPERNFAQVIVVVTEKTRTSEGEVLFEITDLKQVLVRKGYRNLEYTSEEVPLQ
jgi:hypothetical protein